MEFLIRCLHYWSCAFDNLMRLMEVSLDPWFFECQATCYIKVVIEADVHDFYNLKDTIHTGTMVRAWGLYTVVTMQMGLIPMFAILNCKNHVKISLFIICWVSISKYSVGTLQEQNSTGLWGILQSILGHAKEASSHKQCYLHQAWVKGSGEQNCEGCLAAYLCLWLLSSSLLPGSEHQAPYSDRLVLPPVGSLNKTWSEEDLGNASSVPCTLCFV